MDFRYVAPFDRHDWVVDRCGVRIRYVIDFYTGHSAGSNEQISFYLDVRPALDSWEGLKMRLHRLWSPWSSITIHISNANSFNVFHEASLFW